MPNLPEEATWDAGIYQIELIDPVEGGVNGVNNRQAKSLANRTAFLKGRLDNGDVVPAGLLPVADATQRGRLRTVQGAAGVPDRTYVCQKLADDTYAWVRFGQLYLAAAPATGTYQKGEVVLNSSPNPGSPAGWVCTAAGTPGTWKELAPISL